MFLTLCIPFTGPSSPSSLIFLVFPSFLTLFFPSAIDYAFPVWVLPTWMCPLINYLQVINISTKLIMPSPIVPFPPFSIPPLISLYGPSP